MHSNKICIIDDNAAVCESLKFLFASIYNINVEIYSSSVDFLDQFSSDWSGCLIVDFFMPFLNGIELIKELQQRNSIMDIVMISGNATPDVERRSRQAGAKSFISKPFNIDSLLTQVKAILEHQSTKLNLTLATENI